MNVVTSAGWCRRAIDSIRRCSPGVEGVQDASFVTRLEMRTSSHKALIATRRSVHQKFLSISPVPQKGARCVQAHDTRLA